MSLHAQHSLDVCIRDGYKYFGSNGSIIIMDDFDMSVPRGSIYVLLGASGSGKSTILKCIVGLSSMRSGYIYVLGGAPNSSESKVPGSSIGYMPQEDKLCPELTIKETLHYFGCVFNMEEKVMKLQMKKVLSLLQISNANKLIRHLSGGERRRVSFAAAVIHEPCLMVLDEPTVGVDPLLRKIIWDFLASKTKEHTTTIILTTHYYEEAKQADYIGLQRDGKLRVEGNPTAILNSYQATKIETIFLRINQEDESIVHKPNKDEQFPEVEIVPGCLFVALYETIRKSFSRGNLKALLMKNFLQFLRNPGILFFIFLLPIMQVVLFCLAIGHRPKDLQLAVHDPELSPGKLSCPTEDFDCQPFKLSCLYLQILNSSGVVNMKFFEDEFSGLQSTMTGQTWGLLTFDSNFSYAISNWILLRGSTPESLQKKITIKARLDMSDQEIGLTIVDALQEASAKFAKQLVSTCMPTVNTKVVEFPVQFGEPIFGISKPQFIDFAAPGVSLVIVFFLSLAMMSLMLIVDRDYGLMMRSRVAGVHIVEMILAHTIIQLVVISIQSLLTLVCLFYLFKIHCNGNLGLVFLTTLLQGVSGMCFGMIISTICSNEISAIQVATGFFYPALLLSGIIWPIQGMSKWLGMIAEFLPLTSAVMANRAICIRGWGITHSMVYNGFIIALSWILVSLFATTAIMKLKT